MSWRHLKSQIEGPKHISSTADFEARFTLQMLSIPQIADFEGSRKSLQGQEICVLEARECLKLILFLSPEYTTRLEVAATSTSSRFKFGLIGSPTIAERRRTRRRGASHMLVVDALTVTV